MFEDGDSRLLRDLADIGHRLGFGLFDLLFGNCQFRRKFALKCVTLDLCLGGELGVCFLRQILRIRARIG